MSAQPSRAGGPDPGTVIAAIWTRHRDDALKRVAALEDAVVALLENRLVEETRRDAERDAHRIAGSAGTFGFLQASESARQLERILAGTGPILPAGMLLAADEVVALRAALNAAPVPAPAVAKTPAPLTAIRSTRVPALALAPGNMLSGRREVARGNALGFTGTAALPQELPDAAEGLPAGTPTAGATVLLVAGPDVLAAAGAVLVPAGLRVVGLDDPGQVWTALEEEHPDLVILDLDMAQPGGDRLCHEIRSNAHWAGLPILFFTGRSDRATIGGIFAAGADDFVARPFSGPELLARVQARIERTRLLQALVETDPLTGLASRRRAEPGLQLLLGLAKRHSQPFSIARLELNGFENVNDQHGRDPGDTVLRHVGSVLRRSFRCEDVVARWGSHEFLLGIHGLAHDEGKRMIASLLEVLNGKRFTTPTGAPLAVGFRAGIATYPGDGTTVPGLCEAAGQAMHRPERADERGLPAAALPAASPAAAALPATALPAAGHNVDVVVVEDDSALAELLEHAFTTRGYRFHHLADGQSAVDQLAGKAPALRPRVLLLDVDLPVLNGFGVLRQMAAAGTLAGTRVIMLTARSGEREVVEALKLGAVDHVAKPFSVPVLMQRIHRALGT